MTTPDDGPLVLSELVPIGATEQERAAAVERAGQLLADLNEAGIDATCSVETTPDGDVFVFVIEGGNAPRARA
jgi:hypothetical protein